MRNLSFFLLAAAALTLLLLVAKLPAQLSGTRWWPSALGFQLPSLWTGLALYGIIKTSRQQQPVPPAFYLALACALASYGYFAVAFATGRVG